MRLLSFQAMVLLTDLVWGYCCMARSDAPTRFEAPRDSQLGGVLQYKFW